MSTLQLISHIHQLQSLITTVYMGLSELISVAALLWCLNQLARLIEFTYNAGKAVGTVYFRFIKPIVDQIDWLEVARTIYACLKVITVTVIATVIYVVDHLRRDIPTAYFWFERNFIDVPAPQTRKLEIIQIIPAKRARAAGFAA